MEDSSEKYIAASASETADWACDDIKVDIKSNTNDGEIDSLIEMYEGFANSVGYTLDKDTLKHMMKKEWAIKNKFI